MPYVFQHTVGYARTARAIGTYYFTNRRNLMSLSNLEVSSLQWRKARRSVNNGACVEVAAANLHVLVRDSKDQNGSIIQYPGSAWQAFLADARKGHLDPGFR
jgi:Domain of unknown function (DUF397)